MAFEQDLRPPIGEEAAAGGFDLGDREDCLPVDSQQIGRLFHGLAGERQSGGDELNGHDLPPCQGTPSGEAVGILSYMPERIKRLSG